MYHSGSASMIMMNSKSLKSTHSLIAPPQLLIILRRSPDSVVFYFDQNIYKKLMGVSGLIIANNQNGADTFRGNGRENKLQYTVRI